MYIRVKIFKTETEGEVINAAWGQTDCPFKESPAGVRLQLVSIHLKPADFQQAAKSN